MAFTYHQQLEEMDCGATCLRMVAHSYNRRYSLEYLREKTMLTRDGVTLLGISEGAEEIGMQTLALPVNLTQLEEDIPLPCILPWKDNHFVVLHRVRKGRFYIADPNPGVGKTSYGAEEMARYWATDQEDGQAIGNVLVLETTPEFFAQDREGLDKTSYRYVLDYFRSYSTLIWQLVFGLFLASALQLLLPFLLKNMVDYGIVMSDPSFVLLIVVAQGVLMLTTTALATMRRYILLHVGGRVNVSIISDYIAKLARLPMSFFDSRSRGDILQRINDHERLQSFLTGSTLVRVFNLLNFIVFAFVLALWDLRLFGIFLIGTVANVAWIYWQQGRKRDLDFKYFEQAATGKEQLMEMIDGIKDIKQNNATRQKRWAWERSRAGLYRTQLRLTHIDQVQRTGGTAINQLKNLAITLVAALAVLNGQLSIGALVAIHYILAQLNSPMEDLTEFVRGYQEAAISLERMNEIHTKKNEQETEGRLRLIPEGGAISLDGVSFHYDIPDAPDVLRGVSFDIEPGTVTAIVGNSGSGKSSLLNLMLGLYEPTEGEIRIGNTSLATIDRNYWRQQVGVVMQDGYVFSDTLARNIALGSNIVDQERLLEAAKVAQIERFVDKLPAGYNTLIGENGLGLSMGQKQRLLIARAIYSRPRYLFLDEATAGLTAFTELTIVDELLARLRGTTIVMVAHRYSTIEQADQVVVMSEGRVVEIGHHKELYGKRNAYFRLVRNQTLLGN